ncbi:glutaredoxin family protein [Massilia sp. S19_KUP03_FR1]|uniref:glutaredoxin family protein n=1 Tax=Massilia sp. S19_KUP03_FR1 TaxID=3025503 RepID=UPI002FCD73CD
MLELTLFSRSYCHLCEEMLAALRAMASPPRPFLVTVIDIDAAAEAGDAGPLARFDELVPVLFGGLQDPELCHYFLDELAVRNWLAGPQLSSSSASSA